MAEITIPWQQLARMRDPGAGHDLMLEERMRAVLPLAASRHVPVLGNFGALNPAAGAELVVKVATELGLHGLRVACIEGDDVLGVLDRDTLVTDRDTTIDRLPGRLL